MKCPRCGEELKRSKKNPEYGLCYNCRLKFKWREENQRPKQRANTERRKPAKRIEYESEELETQYRFKTFRLIIGIISLLLFLIISLQSCAAGASNILSGSGEVSGSAGFVLALCMAIAGIVTICMRKRESTPAFIVPMILYFVGALLGSANVGTYSDLAIWSVLSAIFAALHIFFLFVCKDKTVIGVIVAVVIVALISGFVAFSSKGSGDSKDNTNKKQSAESQEKKDDDGIIDFDGTGYNVKYLKHETGTDYEGKSCLYYYYTFTNTGEENTSAAASSYVQCFQNGTQCETAILAEDNSSVNNYMMDVQPGNSIEVCQVFSLSDNNNVTIEASDFISLDDSKDTQEISLK